MSLPAGLKLPVSPPGIPVLGSLDWSQLLETYGLRLLSAILVFGIGAWLAKRLSQTLKRVLARARIESTALGFLHNLAYAIMLLVVFVAALAHLGINTTSLLAVLGAAGLAVGLALKDSLSNIASGVMLIVLRPFRDGDHVVIGTIEGVVQEVRVFQTTIKTFDERLVTLPNSSITTTAIINYTVLPTRRIEITVGVGYHDDLKLAQAILLNIAQAHPAVLESPEPFVRVTELADNSVDLMVFAYTRNADFGTAKSEMLEAIRDRLTQNGLSIPYPQRDLHIYRHSVANTATTPPAPHV